MYVTLHRGLEHAQQCASYTWLWLYAMAPTDHRLDLKIWLNVCKWTKSVCTRAQNKHELKHAGLIYHLQLHAKMYLNTLQL